MGAVRADRGRHDLAVVDDEAVADRVDVLVAGDDLALAGGLADLVGAELAWVEATAMPVAGDDERERRPMPAVDQADSGGRRVAEEAGRTSRHAGDGALPASSYPFEWLDSRSTLPSNCHSGFGASPSGVRTRK